VKEANDWQGDDSIRLREAIQIGLDQLAAGAGLRYTPELLQALKLQASHRVQQGQQPRPEVVP
jgi:hypothetical protein